MRPEKKAILEQVRTDMQRASCMLAAEYRGARVGHLEHVRRRLDGAGAWVRIVKNRTAARAAADAGWPSLEGVLRGPLAFVFSTGDPVETAKRIKQCVKEGVPLEVKAGILDGELLSPAAVAELAEVPPRPVLLAALAGTLAAPLTRCIGVMQQKVASLVVVLKALEENKNQAA